MRPPRPIRLAGAVAAACAALLSGATPSAGPPPPEDRPPAGIRTVIHLRGRDQPAAGAIVIEVVEGDGGATAVLRAVTPEEDRLLLEEVVRDDEHFLHYAGVEGLLVDRAAWIRFDTTDPRHAAHLEANPTGLVEAAALFDARPGDPYGDDEIVAVDRRGDRQRVVRTAAGLELTVRRQELRPAPVVGRPRSLPVIPFEDVEQLLPARPL